MPSRGQWTRLGSARCTSGALLGRHDVFDQDRTLQTWAGDFYFDSTPAPVQIPYAWLTPPVRWRADQPINVAQITRGTNGGTLTATNATSGAQYGYQTVATTLDSVADADVDNLAAHQLTYYSGVRMRAPSLTVNLLNPNRTTADLWRILGVTIGMRILIPDAPATWPAGSGSLIVEGIAHQVSQNVRTVTWNTSPVIGTTAGTPGPWFRVGSSRWASSTDLIPF